jgi:hypothetical protein
VQDRGVSADPAAVVADRTGDDVEGTMKQQTVRSLDEMLAAIKAVGDEDVEIICPELGASAMVFGTSKPIKMKPREPAA